MSQHLVRGVASHVQEPAQLSDAELRMVCQQRGAVMHTAHSTPRPTADIQAECAASTRRTGEAAQLQLTACRHEVSGGGTHPSLAYTRGQSGSVASATTKVCRRPASTFVSWPAGAGTCSENTKPVRASQQTRTRLPKSLAACRGLARRFAGCRGRWWSIGPPGSGDSYELSSGKRAGKCTTGAPVRTLHFHVTLFSTLSPAGLAPSMTSVF